VPTHGLVERVSGALSSARSSPLRQPTDDMKSGLLIGRRLDRLATLNDGAHNSD
jgi:acetyltransferase-like isoleucine patch superfamily enzyme